MIRSLTIVKPAGNEREWKRLSAFLESLGFGPAAGWQEGKRKAAAFTAPLGQLEVFTGPLREDADLLVEVSDIADVHARATSANVGAGNLGAAKLGAEKLGKVSPLRRTSWNAELFELEAAGLRIAFWQFENPKPLPFQTIEGELHVSGARFGIVVSRFNAFITERLLQSACDALRRTGTGEREITVVRVPGAFEVPMAARKLAQTGTVDAVICLGLLMRGETSNYEHISDEVARGIGQSAQVTGVPHAYGVLTCDTLEQAIDRAGLKSGNKGFEAAISAVEMVALARKLKPGAKAKEARPEFGRVSKSSLQAIARSGGKNQSGAKMGNVKAGKKSR